jgi:hypothetical protein
VQPTPKYWGQQTEQLPSFEGVLLHVPCTQHGASHEGPAHPRLQLVQPTDEDTGAPLTQDAADAV